MDILHNESCTFAKVLNARSCNLIRNYDIVTFIVQYSMVQMCSKYFHQNVIWWGMNDKTHPRK